jgi:hypothetical protein
MFLSWQHMMKWANGSLVMVILFISRRCYGNDVHENAVIISLLNRL